jgi:hypothetical protein
MPVPNRGAEVESIALVRGAVEALKEALRSLEPGSEIFRSVNQAMERLDKDVPAQQVTPGIERNAMLRFIMAQKRQNPLLGVLGAGQQQQAQPPMPTPTPPPNPAAAGAA